jgi:hypothetical protein
MAVAFRGHLLSASHSHLLARPSSPRGGGEIFDSDDDGDLPSVRQILASPKRVTEVINLTCDDDGDSGDDGNHIEVSCLRYTQTARHRVRLTSTPVDRPLLGHQPTPFTPPPSSLPDLLAHTADDLITSSIAVTPGKKKRPRWSPLCRKLQQRSDKPLNDLSVDALHTGTNSSRSSSTELGSASKDSRAFVTKQSENFPEIPETPIIAPDIE